MSDGKKLEAHLFICTNFREKEGSCSMTRLTKESVETLEKEISDVLDNEHLRTRIP